MMIKHRENWQENGTEQDPFRIESIEDLVAFSMMNEGNAKLTELGLKRNNFSEQYVTLERTLDFESDVSYKDSTTTKYGDLNKDEKVEDIKTELTKKDEGCIGFTPIGGDGNRSFKGTFDGKGNVIRNIYMYRDKSCIEILAPIIGIGYIKNISFSGTIINEGRQAFGVGTAKKITNCSNYCNVMGMSAIAGIGDASTIYKCTNYGKITGLGSPWQRCSVGGIQSGNANNSSDGIDLRDCINYGNVMGEHTFLVCAGIIPSINKGTISNCRKLWELSVWSRDSYKM